MTISDDVVLIYLILPSLVYAIYDVSRQVY